MDEDVFDDLMNEIMMAMEEKGQHPDHPTLMHFVRKYPEHRAKLTDFFATWGVQQVFVELDQARKCQQDRCSAVYQAGGHTMRIFSADLFFVNKQTGAYEFDPQKIGQAHSACMRAYVEAVQHCLGVAGAHVTILRGVPGSGKSTWAKTHAAELDIVVDNTAPGNVDVAPYAALAQAYGVPYEVVTIRVDPAVAAARNVHGVPHEVVEKMAKWLDHGTETLMPWWPHRLIENAG